MDDEKEIKMESNIEQTIFVIEVFSSMPMDESDIAKELRLLAEQVEAGEKELDLHYNKILEQ